VTASSVDPSPLSIYKEQLINAMVKTLPVDANLVTIAFIKKGSDTDVRFTINDPTLADKLQLDTFTNAFHDALCGIVGFRAFFDCSGNIKFDIFTSYNLKKSRQ
jgi:hypothetical protein